MEGRLIEFGEFQTIAKSVLKRICEFCEKNGLKYFLSYGTLIGAVRHGDMIPWDYDIDIMMPREDLNKFLELTKNQDAIENVTVFSWVTHKDYYIPFVKVCDSRTRLVITKTTNPLPLGIWVDIFPTDGIVSVEESTETKNKAAKYIKAAKAPYMESENEKEKLFKLYSIIRSKFKPSSEYLKKAAEIASEHSYYDCDKAGAILSVDWSVEKEYFDKEYTDELIKLPFGDREYYCPSGYDAILTKQYGDYMTLPPEEQRAIPKIKAYMIKE